MEAGFFRSVIRRTGCGVVASGTTPTDLAIPAESEEPGGGAAARQGLPDTGVAELAVHGLHGESQVLRGLGRAVAVRNVPVLPYFFRHLKVCEASIRPWRTA